MALSSLTSSLLAGLLLAGGGSMAVPTGQAATAPKASVKPASLPDPLAARKPALGKATVNLSSFPTDGTPQGNAAQVNAAFDKLRSLGGGILLLPNKTTVVQPRGWLWVPAGVELKGTGSNSTLSLQAPDSNTYSELLKFREGNNAVENLKLTRANAAYGRLIDFGQGSKLYLSGVTLDGARSRYGSNDFAALTLTPSAGETASGLTLRNSKVVNTTYGVVEDSTVRGTVQDVVVDHSTFSHNSATDLEFNAPAGVGTGVTVSNSNFSQNECPNEAAGFAVGLANYQQVSFLGNTFTSYPMNPLHLEDRTAQVLVQGNSFTTTATRETGYASDIIILSGAHDVKLVKNTFDATKQKNTKTLLYVGPGSPTAANPYAITVEGNSYTLAPGDTPFQNDTPTPLTIIS